MVQRRSRRLSADDGSSGGRRSLLALRARGDKAREIEARIAAGDIPVGLTVEEYQRRIPGVFDGLAVSTKDTYGKFLSYFEAWCASRETGLSEIETDHVVTYLETARERSVDPVSVPWLRSTVAAVQMGLEFHVGGQKVDWAEVRLWIDDQRQEKPEAPVSADGLTWSLIRRVVDAAWVPLEGEWPEKTRQRATFDTALLLLMWGCLLRRGEAAAVKWGDISTEQQGNHVYGVLHIPRSKTDRFGRGEVGYVHLGTLAALQEMANACGRDPSKSKHLVFGIGGRQISNRIGAACQRAGLRGRWSGHSPRVGASHDLVSHGFSLLETMQAGRWVRPETVSRYVRSIALGDNGMARLMADDGVGMAMAPVLIGGGRQDLFDRDANNR